MSQWTDRIVSYINNLHPHKHAGLYSIIEQIIQCVIPLWNAALTPLGNPDSIINRVDENPDPWRDGYDKASINSWRFYDDSKNVADMPPEVASEIKKLAGGRKKDSLSLRQAILNYITRHRTFVHPEPNPFDPDRHVGGNLSRRVTWYRPDVGCEHEPWDYHGIDLQRDYAEKGLQVSVWSSFFLLVDSGLRIRQALLRLSNS